MGDELEKNALNRPEWSFQKKKIEQRGLPKIDVNYGTAVVPSRPAESGTDKAVKLLEIFLVRCLNSF